MGSIHTLYVPLQCNVRCTHLVLQLLVTLCARGASPLLHSILLLYSLKLSYLTCTSALTETNKDVCFYK